MNPYIHSIVSGVLPVARVFLPLALIYFGFRFYQREMLRKSAGTTRIEGTAGQSLSTEKMRISKENRAKGVEGELGVATVLENLSRKYGTVVLHDLSMPESTANIDHVLVQSKAVFVIDAKNYSGRVNIKRDSEGKWQLYVGRYKQTALAHKLKKYASAIENDLHSKGIEIKVIPLLAFYNAEFHPDSKYEIEGVMVNVSGIENELMRIGYKRLKEFDTQLVADKILETFPFKS